jgi:hypothetical protein
MNKKLSIQNASSFENNQDVCTSVFVSIPRPISFIKGDTMYINEIEEDSIKKYSSMMVASNSLPQIAISGSSNNDIGVNKFDKSLTFKANENYIEESKVATNQTTSKENLFLSQNFNGDVIGLQTVKTPSFDVFSNLKPHCAQEADFHYLNKYISEGLKCESKSEPLIYSRNRLHPFSFLLGMKKGVFNKKGLLDQPSPSFIDSEDWLRPPNISKEAILNGLEIRHKEGLVLVDTEIMKKFRGIIGDMIGQLLGAAIGRPISLNVQLFEPKSTLQRVADYWSFAPLFLNEAAKAKNALQRMKYVMAFAIGGLYVSTKQLKPFNPLIGETFEGQYEDGTKIYIEHISHYPTTSRFYAVGKNYKFKGYIDFSTTTSLFGSDIYVHQKGPITIEFPELKEEVTYSLPTVHLLNARAEKNRASQWMNSMIFCDLKNSLKSIVKFATNSKYVHGFEGIIFSNEFNRKEYNHIKEADKSQNINLEDKKLKNKIIETVSGSWLVELKFSNDQNPTWDIDHHIPSWIRPPTHALPSDGRFREDLIWLFRMFNTTNEAEKKLYKDYSQAWKLAIELGQRTEREIRKKNKNKK